MPTIPSIRTSIENKDVLVLDEHARNGIFKRNANGRLISYAGGFSVVYPYETTNGEKWAFRCWHADVSNSRRRYEIISTAIQKAHLDFLCKFEYIEKGINVEGNVYPTTRMRWIDGITLKDYICENRDSKELLQALANNFLILIHALHSQLLAHGDLQHGNILVDGNHRLYLVDYDSFYCPELKGEPDNVTGLPDYQHPARCNNMSISEKLDYFSELIIYISILAISENPSLVDKYKLEGADHLLFSKEDFENIRNSQIYNDIHALGKEFQDMLNVLEEYLKCGSIDELLPFDDLLLENKVTFTCSASKLIRGKQNNVRLEWTVKEDADIQLVESNNIRDCKCHESLSVSVNDDTTFRLVVKSKSGILVEKELTIRVFDESVIDFTADKNYSYPTIPIKLSWNVENAKKVWLDSAPVEFTGTKVIEPKESITCVLSVEDEFGIKEKRIDIRMLPLPQIKSLLVPTPNFTSNLSVQVKQPKYSVNVKFPTIKIDWINMEIPKVKSLTDLGLNMDISPYLPKFNMMSSIKKVFNNIKGLNNEK